MDERKLCLVERYENTTYVAGRVYMYERVKGTEQNLIHSQVKHVV